MVFKRFLKLIITALVLLLATACGGNQDLNPQEEPADVPMDQTDTEEPTGGDAVEDSPTGDTNVEEQEPAEGSVEPSGETGTDEPVGEGTE